MTTPSAEISALLKKARSKLKTARIDYDGGQYEDAVSRAYYAAFHAMSAALLSKSMTFSGHGQLIGAFNREFIKTGIFPKESSYIIQDLFDDRQTSDYDATEQTSKETAALDIKNATAIVDAIENFFTTSLKRNNP